MPAHGSGTIPNAHQRKHWQLRIKTWFDQPARAQRRHANRITKARAIAPRPLNFLRPIVRSPDIRHCHKQRLGRGFTAQELRLAKVSRKEARNIGIATDKRRANKSVESMHANAQRLREYKSNLILFPKNAKKPHKGDASEEEMKLATQHKHMKIMPLKRHKFRLEPPMVIDEKIKKMDIFSIQIEARTTARKWGMRAKKAREAAEEANVIGKK